MFSKVSFYADFLEYVNSIILMMLSIDQCIDLIDVLRFGNHAFVVAGLIVIGQDFYKWIPLRLPSPTN